MEDADHKCVLQRAGRHGVGDRDLATVRKVERPMGGAGVLFVMLDLNKCLDL